MRVKSLLLAGSALSTIALAGQAQADTYVSLFGGFNWQSDASGFGTRTLDSGPSNSRLETASVNIDNDTGFNVGGAVGVGLDNWLKGLRTEAEMSYRRNKLQGDFTNSIEYFVNGNFNHVTAGEGGVINGHTTTFAVLANVWYDFDCNWKVKPYVGGGAGWARSTVEFVARTTDSGYGLEYDFADEKSGFAYQLGAGFNYPVMPNVQVGLGYRYFRGPDVRDFNFNPYLVGDAVARTSFDNENHSVNLSLTVGIN